jgi:hypothetical protein
MKLRPRNRAKRCFELSWRYLLFDERYNDGSWSLVHGRIILTRNAMTDKPCSWCSHAWLINGQGLVYDPVLDVQVPWKEYVKNIGATAWVTYSQKEAAAVACEHLHKGPWDVRLESTSATASSA